MRHRNPMPGYYRKNIVRNAQRKFLQRKKREREAKEAAAQPPAASKKAEV